MKLTPRFVLTGVRPHRLDRARQGSHLVAESFDVGDQGGLRPRELVDGRAQACQLVAHSGQRGFRHFSAWDWSSSSTSISMEREVC
jgi:hypothetical protein